MSRGRFRVYQDKDDSKDIHFEVAPEADAGPIPPDQLELKDEVERSLTVLRTIFSDSDLHFNSYFRQLLSLAQTGLVGDYADPLVARQALRTLKYDVTIREGGRIKNKYMKLLGVWAFAVGIPSLVAGSVVYTTAPDRLV